jgi:ABC-type nitrate/sulfonate/bicarbonate transport system substrate-binding protein
MTHPAPKPGYPDGIWYSHCGYSPLAMAVQLGWIYDELVADGIALRSVKRDGSREDQLSHYDHHLAYSIRQGGNVPALWARSLGVDTRLVGLNWLDEYQAVIALPRAGIRTAKDLAGRRLGLHSANHPVDHIQAANLRGFAVALELAGLDIDRDVELVALREEREHFGGTGAEEGAKPFRWRSLAADALRDGRVDAIFARGPQGVALADALGAHVVAEISEHPDPLVRANNGSPRPLTIDRRFLEEQPRLVERLLRRIVGVGRWAEQNADHAARLIARQGGVSESVVHRAYRGNLHRRLHTTLDDTALAGLGCYKDFLVSRGFLPADFPIEAWTAPEPLSAVLASPLRLIA